VPHFGIGFASTEHLAEVTVVRIMVFLTTCTMVILQCTVLANSEWDGSSRALARASNGDVHWLVGPKIGHITYPDTLHLWSDIGHEH
jgi:hypothetical protein